MATRNTGIILGDKNGDNATKTHLSTNIIVKIAGNSIGACQKISVEESRSIEMIPSLAVDGWIDSAPNKPAEVSGSASRIRFASQRILQAFSRPYIHVKSQRIPFDIEIQDTFASSDPSNSIITIIKNVWIKSCSYSYNADNYIITDDLTWVAEDIYSIMNNRNVAQALGEGQNNPITLNSYERQADRGLYRGALSASGLMDALISDPVGG